MDSLNDENVLEDEINVIETDIDEPSNIKLPEQTASAVEPVELTPGRKKLHSWLNRDFRIVMTDGRILTGIFLCTDADANVILGMCSEFTVKGVEDRILGLVMVPGRHIVSMEVDVSQ